MDLPNNNYAKIAESMGCYGEVVTDPNEIKAALKRARNSNKPAVLDVRISSEVPYFVQLEWKGAIGFVD